MNEHPTMNGITQSRLRRWRGRQIEKLRRPAGWIFFKTPIHHEAHRTDFMNGLHELMWSFICGYDLRFSLHLANIWWGRRWLP